ncbi:hypothetical protein [Kocuria rosea]|uniref:hypothetical protein n=1 Tax=Kocuria rosea TaxID=1275 RepID=UPI00232C8EA4|nr:hypothetical protein [Kocuria rosea]
MSRPGDAQAGAQRRPRLRFVQIGLLVILGLGVMIGALAWAGTVWNWPNHSWWWAGQNKDQLAFIGLAIPLGTLLIAALVYRRDQWWKRAEWALTAVTENGSYSRRLAGALALDELRKSRFAFADDLRIVENIGNQLIDEDVGDEFEDDDLDSSPDAGDNGRIEAEEGGRG